MTSLRHNTIGNESLENWEFVGSGGFGHVYKARHKDWSFNVAIKILRPGVCPSTTLFDEAHHMERASCEFVLRLYGIYQGRPPRETSEQEGLVMEFMKRGCVQSLQKKLCGPPPWPLVFRLVHQVAVGMNFLHSQTLMHQDLKPSNVLLNVDLNARLADFGLCRVSTSALNSQGEKREPTGEVGGSYKYMPPEAFMASYEPCRSFDVYSYGILLWSIVTGKEPYPMADYDRVEVAIAVGDRPSCHDIDQTRTKGLGDLVDLMKRCWDGSPSARPVFRNIVDVTEKLFSMHEEGIYEAVGQVIRKLEQPTNSQASTRVAVVVPVQRPEPSHSNDTMDSGYNSVMSIEDKAKFVDDNRATLIQRVTKAMAVTEELGNMVHRETYSLIVTKAIHQDKVRLLYNDSLHSGGDVVKAAFYDAVKNHHPRLVEQLSGGSSSS